MPWPENLFLVNHVITLSVLFCTLLVSSLIFPQIFFLFIGLISCGCSTGQNLMLLVNQVIVSMDAICMWSLNKSFISCSLWQLNSIALMLYFRFWITSLLFLRFVILIHARSIYATRDFSLEVCLTAPQWNQEPTLSNRHMTVLLDTRWYGDC